MLQDLESLFMKRHRHTGSARTQPSYRLDSDIESCGSSADSPSSGSKFSIGQERCLWVNSLPINLLSDVCSDEECADAREQLELYGFAFTIQLYFVLWKRNISGSYAMRRADPIMPSCMSAHCSSLYFSDLGEFSRHAAACDRVKDGVYFCPVHGQHEHSSLTIRTDRHFKGLIARCIESIRPKYKRGSQGKPLTNEIAQDIVLTRSKREFSGTCGLTCLVFYSPNTQLSRRLIHLAPRLHPTGQSK